jgi:hypothetical protein
MFDPYEHFSAFYTNPLIQSIKDRAKWTISDKDKMPIDMYALMVEHRISGALSTDENSLVSLDKLCQYMPTAANNAYYLDALIDGFVVLDIEPKCPDDIKSELLRLPYEYGEVSMSGKGYHLLFKMPDCISEYPAAQKKIVLKEEHGYYEILMNHYVTFTRNAIPLSENADAKGFEKIFRELASVQTESAKGEAFDVTVEPPDDIPFEDLIVSTLMKQNYRKTIEDFDNDNSLYEYAFIGFLHYKLKLILNVSRIKATGHEYTDNEKAWIIYKVAQEVIPYRSKHEETRCQLPWLLFLAKSSIEKDIYKS